MCFALRAHRIWGSPRLGRSSAHVAVATEPDSAALGSHLVLELSDSTKDPGEIRQLRLRPLEKYLAREVSSTGPPWGPYQ